MMKKIFDFLAQHKDVAFGTVDAQGNPALRIFQIMLVDEESKMLYFATSARKEVWGQLQHNPNIEILAFADGISVRIRGQVQFEVSDEIAQQIYRENPVLPRLYPHYTDLDYFAMPIQKVDYYDLNPHPPVMESYSF